MSKLKNNLDERQEQALLKIEHNGCWFAFWGLLIVLIVQQFIYGFDIKYVAGEWIVLMALAVYIVSACIKNGIWDRHLQPDAKTNIIVSLAASLAFGIFMFFGTYVKYSEIIGSIVSGVLSSIMVFVLCCAALTMSAYVFKKKQLELEQEPSDVEMDEDTVNDKED